MSTTCSDPDRVGEVWDDAFRDYFANPGRYWPPERSYHVSRLHGLGHSAEAIVAEARRRVENRPHTMLVPNCGASGSHWLTALLGTLPGFADCGETYLPPELEKDIRRWSAQDRAALIDSVHLAHAVDLRDATSAILVNSAQSLGWRLAQHLAPASRTVLLVRDPVEIVLSRTFRKDEHRQRVASDATDETYLARNVQHVQRYFDMAGTHEPDAVVRYEDLRADTVSVLARICALVGVTVSVDDCRRALEAHPKDGRTVNYFDGPRPVISDQVHRQACRAVAALRTDLGYPIVNAIS